VTRPRSDVGALVERTLVGWAAGEAPTLDDKRGFARALGRAQEEDGQHAQCHQPDRNPDERRSTCQCHWFDGNPISLT